MLNTPHALFCVMCHTFGLKMHIKYSSVSNSSSSECERCKAFFFILLIWAHIYTIHEWWHFVWRINEKNGDWRSFSDFNPTVTKNAMSSYVARHGTWFWHTFHCLGNRLAIRKWIIRIGDWVKARTRKWEKKRIKYRKTQRDSLCLRPSGSRKNPMNCILFFLFVWLKKRPYKTLI